MVYNGVLRQCLKFGSVWWSNVLQRPRCAEFSPWDMLVCSSVNLHVLSFSFGSNWFEWFLPSIWVYVGLKCQAMTSQRPRVSRTSKWTKLSRASHMPKKVIKMLIKCFRDCIVDLKWFGGQMSKNVQIIKKLVSRQTSVF